MTPRLITTSSLARSPRLVLISFAQVTWLGLHGRCHHAVVPEQGRLYCKAGSPAPWKVCKHQAALWEAVAEGRMAASRGQRLSRRERCCCMLSAGSGGSSW